MSPLERQPKTWRKKEDTMEQCLRIPCNRGILGANLSSIGWPHIFRDAYRMKIEFQEEIKHVFDILIVLHDENHMRSIYPYVHASRTGETEAIRPVTD